MEHKNKVINKLALVLLSIIVLELIIIRDQVQPVKAIKKKMFLKKMKKLLPLLALVKPKKKIILLPIPIPVFNNQGMSNSYHPVRPNQRPLNPMQSHQPTSFVMMTEPGSSLRPDMMSVSMLDEPWGMRMPMMSYGSSSSSDVLEGFSPTPMLSLPAPSSAPPAVMPLPNSPMAMLMPSMTMTIQSEPGGGSAIEFSTNLGSNNQSNSALTAPAKSTKLRPHQPSQPQLHYDRQRQQQHIQQHNEQFPEEPNGDQYYSSPWTSGKQPLASPAKLYRDERLRNTIYKSHQTFSPINRPHPSNLGLKSRYRSHDQQQQLLSPATGRQIAPIGQQQQQQDELEFEELVATGPAQLMPIYQTANGQLHVSPPPPLPSDSPATSRPAIQHDEISPSDEVQTLADSRPSPLMRPAVKTSGRLSSPALKVKQQQLN